MFADPKYQVSLDIVNDRDMIVGTKNLKPHLKQKHKSLQDMGWKHIVIHEDQLSGMTTLQKIIIIIKALKKYQKKQIPVLQYQRYERGQ